MRRINKTKRIVSTLVTMATVIATSAVSAGACEECMYTDGMQMVNAVRFGYSYKEYRTEDGALAEVVEEQWSPLTLEDGVYTLTHFDSEGNFLFDELVEIAGAESIYLSTENRPEANVVRPGAPYKEFWQDELKEVVEEQWSPLTLEDGIYMVIHHNGDKTLSYIEMVEVTGNEVSPLVPDAVSETPTVNDTFAENIVANAPTVEHLDDMDVNDDKMLTVLDAVIVQRGLNEGRFTADFNGETIISTIVSN